MSRRYGRNQKRRDRKEIARWKQAYEMSDGLLKHISDELRDAKSTIAEMLTIIKAVSRFSVALPPKKVDGERRCDKYQIEVLPALDFNTVIGGACAPSAVSFRRIDLYALRAFLEERRDAFQTAVHLEYSAGPHSAYMISEMALRSLPREVLMRRLVPEIGLALIEHLRGAKNG